MKEKFIGQSTITFELPFEIFWIKRSNFTLVVYPPISDLVQFDGSVYGA